MARVGYCGIYLQQSLYSILRMSIGLYTRTYWAGDATERMPFILDLGADHWIPGGRGNGNFLSYQTFFSFPKQKELPPLWPFFRNMCGENKSFSAPSAKQTFF